MSRAQLTRRALLLVATALIGACAQAPTPTPPPPPIVFVHGNGDSAAVWMTTLWRFESNGWPRERLHAIDLPYPLARDADDREQAGRSSNAQYQQVLATEIDRVLRASGASQVVLMGSSGGGYPIRSYVMSGGAAKVSHVILGGVPNHGVRADAGLNPASVFNGAGPFLTALNNQGGAGIEITPGPQWMTVRSDNNDKFAQPDALWLGARGTPTNVTFAGPELKGALNVILPGVDHREAALGPQAFAVAFRFLAGREPATAAPAPEAAVVLAGKVSGLGLDNNPDSGAFVNNLPLQGATVEVYATDPASGERLGEARWRKTVGADGQWGPFAADGRASYEFVISAPGYAVTHIYRSPFVRSSSIVHLRATRQAAADKTAGSVLSLVRPRGYFGVPRDTLVFDGNNPAPGISPGVAGLSASTIRLPAAAPRAVVAEFNSQRIVARSWPAADNHLVQLELH